MLKNGCILYDEQCRFIYKVSFLSVFSALYALYKRHYDMALVPAGVFLTSVNYWRKPDYSWRRYVDMSCVTVSLSYQMFRAYKSENAKMYYFLVFLSICSFEIAKYYYRRKLYWHSAYAHSMLHIIANLSNFVLYSGNIPSIYKLN